MQSFPLNCSFYFHLQVSCCYEVYNISRGLRFADKHIGKYEWAGIYSDALKASIAFEVVNFIMSVLLLVCAAVHQAKYKVGALIWVAWTCICYSVLLICIIVACVMAKRSLPVIIGVVVGYGISLVLGILCILVVISYYQQLGDENRQFSGLVNQEYSLADAAPSVYSEKPMLQYPSADDPPPVYSEKPMV